VSQVCASAPSFECTQYEVVGELHTPYDVYLVVAGVDDSNLGGIRGASCGIEYDPTPDSGIRVLDWYFCTDGLQFPNVGPHGEWPASGSGNRMTWTTCQREYTGESVHAVLGALYVYAYSADELRVVPNRNLGSGPELRLADCGGSEVLVDTTGVSTAVAAFGGGTPYNPCQPGICELSPASYDFGDVPLGDSSDLTVTVTNADPVAGGSLPIHIQTECDDFEIISGGGIFLLPPGGVHEFVVRFTPITPENNLCTVDIGPHCSSLELAGNTRPEIGLGGEESATSSADFSTTWGTTHQFLPALVVPESGGTLEVGATGLFEWGAHARVSAEDSHVGWFFGSGYGCGRRANSFYLSPTLLAALTEDGVVGVTVRNFTIEATCPVNVHDVTLRYRSGSGPVRFGNVLPGESRTRGIRVTNSGHADLEVSGIEVVGGHFSADPTPFTIPPDSSRVVTVVFAPLLLGKQAGTLYLRSNDPHEPEVTVALQGGIEASQAVLSPAQLTFDLPPREESTQAVVLSNEGERDLTFQIDPPAPPPRIGSGRLALQARSLVSRSEICSPEPSGPMPTMTPCTEYNVEADLLTPTTVYLCVNTDSALVGVAGVSCGLEYNGRPANGVDVMDWALCADGLEFSSSDWPASGSGNRITWVICQTNTIGSAGVHAIVGAFYLYAYGNDMFRITANRTVGWPEYSYAPCGGTEVYLDTTQTPAVAFSAGAVVPGRNPCAEPTGETAIRPLAGSLISWLAVSPLSGVVPPKGQVELSVTASTANFVEGTHKSSVVLHTNDPVHADLPLPVTLNVTPVPSNLVAATVEIEPDSFDPGSGASWLTTLVELPSGYDPAAIRPETVRAMKVVSPDPDYGEVGDGNGNGVPDREFRFARGALLAAFPAGEEVQVVVTGDVGDAAGFHGEAHIRVTRPQVVSPNGGETLSAHGRTEIVWDTPPGWNPTRVEIQYSPDGGESWGRVAADAGASPYAWETPSEPTEEGRLQVSLFDGEGMLGMDASDGDFRIQTGEIDTEPVLQPAVFALHQNAPNPFAASTVILYELPEELEVSLRLYDVSGRRVLELPQGSQPAGEHALSWDGRDGSGRPMPAGVYFYELLAGPYRETRRMLVVR